MIIHKLIQIKGIGKYVDCVTSQHSWNGVLEKNTAIYANNASGKTTFTQILKSLQDNDKEELLKKKKTFGYTQDPLVELLIGSGKRKMCRYSNGSWNVGELKIDVFDSYYVENNIYVISLDNDQNSTEKIAVIIGNKSISLFNRLNALKKERKKEANRRRNWKAKIKRNEPDISVHSLQSQIQQSLNHTKKINSEITYLEQCINKETERSGFIDEINSNLELLCPDLHISKLNRKSNNLLVYNIEIKGYEVRSETNSVSLSRTLSEGEKNALAFAFFVARLNLRQDLSNSLVVFDDPISSLDYNRRNTTLNKLRDISNRSNQFILLSHDLRFVKDFCDKVDNVLTLRISNDNITSYFDTFDIKKETLTGVSKDMIVLKDFVDNGNASSYTPRDVVRCIRPLLEGFLRIKYFGYMDEKIWLGDMISLFRESTSESVFYSQKENLSVLADINDYSKTYHHSNPNWLEEPINETELKQYCKKTLELIHKL